MSTRINSPTRRENQSLGVLGCVGFFASWNGNGSFFPPLCNNTSQRRCSVREAKNLCILIFELSRIAGEMDLTVGVKNKRARGMQWKSPVENWSLARVCFSILQRRSLTFRKLPSYICIRCEMRWKVMFRGKSIILRLSLRGIYNGLDGGEVIAEYTESLEIASSCFEPRREEWTTDWKFLICGSLHLVSNRICWFVVPNICITCELSAYEVCSEVLIRWISWFFLKFNLLNFEKKWKKFGFKFCFKKYFEMNFEH